MLKWIKRLFILILFVLAFVVGITLTAENSQSLSLMVFGYSLPELTLGLWLMLVLLLGVLCGFLLSYLSIILGKQSLASKDRKIRQLQKELNQLRASSIKPSINSSISPSIKG